MSNWILEEGDVLAVLQTYQDNVFDALMCDPPYGISFMGKKWDYDIPSVEVWCEAIRVLKPGAPLLAFGGSRTYHRMACAIEDAGFEIRDQLMWLYGQGFPKSLDVSRAIDAAAGAKRASVGPSPYSARKPNGSRGIGYVGANDTPGAPDITAPATPLAAAWDGYGTALKPAFEPICLARKPLDGTVVANVARWGVGGLAVDACRIAASVADIEAAPQHSFGVSPPRAYNFATGEGRNGEVFDMSKGRWPANLLLNEESAALLDSQSKSASRFFYTSKVSTKEKNFGCEGGKNSHPTLKPLSLTKWLARLIMPPTEGASIIIPYAGAGSEMIGALQAGWSEVIGVENNSEYASILRARVRAWVPEAERGQYVAAV